MTELTVDLYDTEIGVLRGERDRFDFHARPLAMSRFGVGATTLSVAVPFLAAARPAHLSLRRNFFEEVLAEGGIRAQLAARARLDVENTLGLLARYGRDVAGALQIWDFNQALGFRGDQKYETASDGRLRAIAGILRRHAARRENQRLLRMVTLSAALGNLDLHAKNISVIHAPDGELTLAPMYDIVPQLHLEGIDHTLALFIANTNDPHALTGGDLVAEAESWGLRAPAPTIIDTLDQITAIAARETPRPGAEPSLPSTIARRVDRLLSTLGETTPPAAAVPDDRAFLPRIAGGGWGGPVGR